MKRAFAITAAATALALDGKNRGRLSVIVSNTRERPVQARAGVVAEDGTSGAWLHLDDEQVFPLPPLGSRQLTLIAMAPDTAPAGIYRCHAAVWAEDAPDEDYVDGPTIAVTVRERPMAARRRLPWAVPVLAVLGLIAAVAPWWWATGATDGWQRRMRVPNLVGLSSPQAAELLSPALHFGTVSQLAVSDRPLGEVVAQEPPAGTVVAVGGAIDVTVHGGILVPDLAGQWIEKARRMAQASSLAVGPVTTAVEPSALPLGSVLRQDPLKHTPVAAGTPIAIVLLGGVAVPDLRGATLDFARTAATTLGLALEVSADATHRRDGLEKPAIATQDPAPGTRIHAGAPITVQVVYPTGNAP